MGGWIVPIGAGFVLGVLPFWWGSVCGVCGIIAFVFYVLMSNGFDKEAVEAVYWLAYVGVLLLVPVGGGYLLGRLAAIVWRTER